MIHNWNSRLRQTSIWKWLLLTFGVVGILGVAAAMITAQSLSDSNNGGGGQRLQGVFLVNITPDLGGPPPSMVIRLFTPEGEVLGPQASLFGGIVCGEWLRTGNRQFGITLASFNYASTGPVSATVKTVGTVTLNNEGTELTGRFKIESFDLAGNLLTSFTATVHGRRIQVEQFP